MVEEVFSQMIPPPNGHYAHACRAGDFVFVSGQLGVGPKGDPATPVEEQTRTVLNCLAEICRAAGCSMEDVAQVSIYVADLANWPRINAIYQECFGNHRPARAIIPVTELHFGAALELAATVYSPRGE